MAGKQTISGATTVEYLKKHPKMPLLTLGRLMSKENPKLFPTAELARKSLLYYTGKNGGDRSAKAADRYDTKREKGVSGQDVWKDMMPDTWMRTPKEFVLPKSIRKLLVISDTHAPFHDPDALSLAIQYGIDDGADGVLLNGDTMDFYACSFHEKDPRMVDWQGEIEAGRSILKMFRAAFPNAPIYFKSGNHEFRLERHLMKYADMLLGMPEFEIPALLHFGEHGVTHIANKTNIKAGKLNIIHGDEYKGSGGVNPARWLSLRTGEPTICGHFHRTSAHMDKTIRHDIRGWWSTGCMCELSPEYMPYSQWNLGFAMVYLNADGTFEVDNKIIVGGVVR